MVASFKYIDKGLLVMLDLSYQGLSVGYHYIKDLGKDDHDFSEGAVASLQLPVSQVDTFEKRTDLKEKLERVLLILHIAVVPHFCDQLSLNPLKFFPEDVVEDDLMEGAYQLHDGMACVFINKTCHCRVFQVLQLVAQVDRVDNLGVGDGHSLLILDLLL